MSVEHVLASPGLPHDDDGPSFDETWQADAFAIVVALIDAGGFTAGEWSEALGTAISAAQAAGDPDLGDTYYGHWSRRSRACASSAVSRWPPPSTSARPRRSARTRKLHTASPSSLSVTKVNSLDAGN